MNKKITALVLALGCIVGSTNVLAEEANPITDTSVMKEYVTTLQVGSKTAVISGQAVEMIAEPAIKDNHTFLPLRFLTEKVLDAKVNWDNQTKIATVISGETVVEVQLNSNKAYINGEEVYLDVPPMIINESILLPVRFMSETFGMTVDYKSSDKSITIRSTKPNKAPIADFSLDNTTYSEGQAITIADKSYDQDLDGIIKYEWQLNGTMYNSLKELQAAVKKLKAGSYEIILTVQDYCGAWSAPVSKQFTIRENKAPVITEFKTNKASYAQGEEIDFTYLYENEDWEEIKSARWTYRYASEPTYSAVITKPTAFFAQGEYIVTLQLTDASGKVSEVKQTTVTITNEVKESEFSYKFTKGQIGDTIDNINGINYREKFKDVNVKSMLTNTDTLVMSDSPEDVQENGVLYTSSFEGRGRLLLHHLSAFDVAVAKDKMLVIVAENTHHEPVNITLSNKVIKGPAADVMYLGQQLLKDYLNGVSSESMTLAPGEKVYLYTSSNKNWLKGQCISGLMDIATTGQIQLTTAVMDKIDSIYHIDELEDLDKSIHVRGTFTGTIIDYELTPQASEESKLIVGQYEDEWVSGLDAITGEEVKNKGNYGVTYRIKITATEDMGVILNPRADIFRGAIRWQDEGTFLAPANGYFMNTSKKAVMLGVIKAGETRTLEYMLPNGSSAPILLGFVPKSMW